MTTTRPITEQLRFTSSLTGSHILDDYLEACEIGGKTLPELLDIIFDANGEFDAAAFDFRLDPDTANLQMRIGTFTDPDDGWRDIGDSVFRTRGEWAPATDYNRLDLVTYLNNLYVAIEAHTSTGSFDVAKWMVALDDTPLQDAVTAAQAAQAAAEAAVLAVTGAVNIPTDTWTGDGTTQIFTPSIQPSSSEACLVTIDNVVQEPGVAYNLVGPDLVFTGAPPSGAKIVHRYLGGTLNQMPVINKSSNYTLTAADNFKLFRTTGTFTLSLPEAAEAGNGYLVVLKVVSGTVTLDPNGAETIDGNATKVVSSDVWCFCDGTQWLTLNTGTGGGGAVDSVFGRTGTVTAQSGDYTASQITNTPSGNIAATTVQAAIDELDSEKASISHNHDASYAPLAHNHDSAYAALTHDHDADYAPLGHNHDGAYQPLDADLTAVAGLGTTGLVARTGAGAANTRTITAGTGISVSNGNGVSGNPTISIATDGVSNTLLANMPAGTIKGNNTGGTGDPADLTASQVTAMLSAMVGDTGAGGAKGLVPAPSAGDASKYLRGDGTWSTPEGGASDAASVTFTPAGNIAATNVQAAIQELDSEKAASGHSHSSDQITHSIDDTPQPLNDIVDAVYFRQRPFVVGTMLNGKPGASQTVLRFTFPFTVEFRDADTTTMMFAKCGTPPTGDAIFDVYVDGVPVLAVVGFYEGLTDGAIGFGEGLTLHAGETLTIVAPASPDATLADISITLCGWHSTASIGGGGGGEN